MRKFFVLFIALLSGMTIALGQGVPNGDFESWINKKHFDNPRYMTTSNMETYMNGGAPNVTKSTDAYSGNSAIKLESGIFENDTTYAYFVFGRGTNHGLEGGTPYTEKPDSFKAWFKYNIAVGTQAIIILQFKKAGVTVSDNLFFLPEGSLNTWTELAFKLDSFTDTPDTLAMGIASANPFTNINHPANWVMVDKMMLTGVTAQLPNNDFEEWLSLETEEPALWYTFNALALAEGIPYNVTKSNDAKSGNYSISIKTAQFSSIGNNIGMATTGNFGEDGFGGGFPVAKKADSLSFYYKYSNTANPFDTANFILFYTKEGSIVDAGFGNLGAKSQWTYKVIVFDPDTTIIPDSCNIILSSSFIFGNWGGIGNELKVDDILLYYGTVGIPLSQHNMNSTLLYPNPATNNLIINFVLAEASDAAINIYSVDGKLVKQQQYSKLSAGEHHFTLDISDLNTGNYIMSIYNGSADAYFSKFTVIR